MCTCDLTYHVYLRYEQGKVGRWRKAEGYMSAIRLHAGREEYQPWKNFSWSDFEERNKLRKTYYARHAPFSDGKDHSCFNGLVKTPSTWDEQRNEKVLPARKKRPRKVKKAAEKPKDSPTKRVYNLATGEFKEVISIDE